MYVCIKKNKIVFALAWFTVDCIKQNNFSWNWEKKAEEELEFTEVNNSGIHIAFWKH